MQASTFIQLQFVPGGVIKKSDFLWYVKMCVLVDRYQHFEGKCCHSLQNREMMEAASYTPVYQITQLYNSEKGNTFCHRLGLKSHSKCKFTDDKRYKKR
jgi:hypothetical protein